MATRAVAKADSSYSKQSREANFSTSTASLATQPLAAPNARQDSNFSAIEKAQSFIKKIFEVEEDEEEEEKEQNSPSKSGIASQINSGHAQLGEQFSSS